MALPAFFFIPILLSQIKICKTDLGTGLESQYPFDADKNDQSGHLNHCTNYSNLVDTYDRWGLQKGAQYFNGVDSFLVCPISSSTFASEWTISVWINEQGLKHVGGIISNNYIIRSAPILSKRYVPETLIGMHNFGVTDDLLWIDLGIENLKHWLFIVLKWSRGPLGLIELYVFQPGMTPKQNSTWMSWIPNFGGQITIGKANEMDNQYFNGSIDDVRIQNRSLSINEIHSLYCNPGLVYYPGNYSCLNNCPDGQWINDSDCSKCNNSCLTCNSDNGNSCTSCPLNLGLMNNNCLLTCPEGFLINNSVCESKIQGLVSYQPFNGNSDDQSGNQNQCTNNGAALDSDRNSIMNAAYYFNGLNSYIQCTIPQSTFSLDWTISVWIKHTTINNQSLAGIISNNVNIQSAPGLGMYAVGFPNQIGSWNVGGPSPIYNIIDLENDHIGKWIFITLSRQDNKLKLYCFQEGKYSKQNETTAAFLLSQTSQIFIGSIWSNDMRKFNGIIDDVRIQNRSLYPSEIQSLFCFPNKQYYSVNSSCLLACPIGFYANASECMQCHPSCKTCDQVSYNCTSCDTNISYLENGRCQSPIPDGLVSFYPLKNELSNYFSDWIDTCSSRKCKMFGGTITYSTDRFGNQQSAILFDGATNQLNCTIDPSTFSAEWTIAAWIQRLNFTDWAGIVSNNVFSLGAPVLSFKQMNGGGIVGSHQLGYWHDGVEVDLGNDHLNKWIFAVLAKQQNTTLVYAFSNGRNSLFSSSLINYTFNSTSNIQVGNIQTWDIRLFKGIIQDIQLQNRALNYTEIIKLYCYPNNNWNLFQPNSTCMKDCPKGQFSNDSICIICNDSCRTCTISQNNCTSCSNSNALLLNGRCLSICPEGYINDNSICKSKIEGLVAYYPFALDSSDWSGNNYHCENHNAQLTSDRFGLQNNAQSFDGSNSWMLCQLANSSFENDWTISVWINHTSANYMASILSNNKGGIWHAAGLLFNGSTNQIGLLNIITGFDGTNNGTFIDLGEDHFQKWIFIVMKWENSMLKEYAFQNGEQCSQNESYINWNMTHTEQLVIGRKSPPNKLSNFNGSIDDVRIFNRSLSNSEIQSLYCFPNKQYFAANCSCLSDCPTGYQKNESECAQCYYQQCKGCALYKNNCTSCISSLLLHNYTCLQNCPEGQFNDTNFICNKCNNSCRTCNNNMDNCTSCQNNSGYLESKCQFECPEGFFINGTICSRCNLAACKTCNISDDFCTSCQANMELKLNKCTPKCSSKQWYNYMDQTCLACQSNCDICKNQQECSKCASGYAISWMNSSNNICEKPYCLSNEFRINGTCNLCPRSCKTCNSEKQCSSCLFNNGLYKNSDKSTLCIECRSNETQLNNYCVPKCNDGQYLNKTTNLCNNCSSPCKFCISISECLTCNANLFLTEEKNCVQSCPNDYFVDTVNDTRFCIKCQITNCKRCSSIIECQECLNSTFLNNGKCIYQCPSSKPANSKNVCSSSDNILEENQELVNSMKEEFSKALLSIFSTDEATNSISAGNLNLSQEASNSIINSFLNLTDEIDTSAILELMTSSMVGDIIKFAVNSSFSSFVNSSAQDVFDQKENLMNLCEATKMSELANYSTKCMDIMSNIKNDKMTFEQTKGIIDIIVLTAKPRVIKAKENKTNSTEKQESIYTYSEKGMLFDTLNSAANSLCIRNQENLTSINQTSSTTDIVFKNITLQTTSIKHNKIVEVISLKLFNNYDQKDAVYKSIELDSSLEVVPKSNSIIVSKVLYINVLKVCSGNISNSEQPTVDLNESNLNISIYFEVSNSSFEKQQNEDGFQCSFWSPSQQNSNDSTWEILGVPKIESENNVAVFRCLGNNRLGFYSILQNNTQNIAASGNKSFILIISLSVGGVVVAGLAAVGIWWQIRSKRKKQQIAIAKDTEKKAKNKVATKVRKENSTSKKKTLKKSATISNKKRKK